MTRVASVWLSQLPIERLRRSERRRAPPESAVRLAHPVDDDPGACSVPRGGGWRPGARWARQQDTADATALPAHQRPSMREMGRRSEAAQHPFKASQPADAGSRSHHGIAGPAEAAPLVLVGAVGRQQLVTAACPAALALGLVPGMPATQARALVPHLDVRPAQPDADAALLDRLAEHAARCWTPAAAVSAPDGLWLEIGGSDHLFGGEERFCRKLVAFLARLDLTARVAVAGTPGAAHAVARHSRQPITRVGTGTDVAALAGLPVAALRLTPDAVAAAKRFGLDRIGDLLRMPRAPLAKRLGMDAILRLDQALGRASEPIVPVVPFEPPVATRRLLEPIGTAEAIATVITDLVTDVVELLRTRGLGARALQLLLLRVDGGEQRVSIGTARATRDAAHLSRLLGLRIETIDPGMGIEQGRLLATRVEPLGAQALGTMLDGGAPVADVATLVDTLAGRIGEAALYRVAPVESEVPERAVTPVAPLDSPGGWPAWARPATLLRRPEPLSNVVALLPDHPPRRFSWRGRTHVVVAGDGPERIHGDWWYRDAEVWSVRDYWRVEDADGARFWLFRRGDGVKSNTGDLSWHLHGVFG